MTLYEQRVLAYVDILGWSEACKMESERLAAAAQVFHAVAGYRSAGVKKQLQRDPNIRVNPMYLQVQAAAFSDNFVLSMPADYGARIFSVVEVCRRLLKLGFATRGGVTIGPVHHLDNVVFGPALTEAVELEKQANFPRLLCSDALVEHLASLPKMEGMNPIVVDQYGERIVNLFDPGISMPDVSMLNLVVEDWDLAGILQTCEAECALHSKAGEHKRADKWRYMGQAARLMLRALPAPVRPNI